MPYRTSCRSVRFDRRRRARRRRATALRAPASPRAVVPMPPAHSPLALALCALVLAAPARAPRPFDPFDLWDSAEERAAPRRRPPAAPKQNTTKIKKNDAGKVQRVPSVNADGFTRITLTERPISVNYLYPAYPGVNVSEISYNSLNNNLVSENKVLKPVKTGKATTVKPPTSTRRPPQRSTTSKPRTRRPSTPRPSTPGTTRRPGKPRPSTTRRPSTRRPSTRKPVRRKDPPPARPRPLPPPADPPCDKVNSNWFSSWFGVNKIKTSLAPPGIFTGIYNFFSGTDRDDEEDEPNRPSEYDGWFINLFDRGAATTPVTTTIISTTTRPPTTTTAGSWFNTLVAQEDDDGAYSADQTNAPPRKKLKKTYKGYQLIRVFADAPWKVRELKELQYETEDSGVTWWTAPALNYSGDILVPPSLLSDIKDHLSSVGLEYDVVIWDLQKAIQYENPKLSKKQRADLVRTRGHPLSWRRYHRYADHLRYLEYLALAFPRHVELLPMGRSAEGLPLVGAKVSQPGNWSAGNKKWRLRSRMKPAVWLDGGLHAREWASPAVTSWILHTLVEGEHGEGGDSNMLKMADWYILPVANPDGYEHSHTHDRLWHKTRSRHSSDHFYYNSWFPWNWGRTDCIGVDPNRNWDYHWGGKGSSKDPCHENYAGPYAFSEPETKSISKFIMDHKERIKVYISLHSYSQMWLVPSSQSRIPYPDNAELMEMGKLAVNALSDMYGTKYKVGSMPDLVEPISGASYDWAKGIANVKYSFMVKMRDQHGPYGFLLPGSQIIPTARETWEAIKVIVDNL